MTMEAMIGFLLVFVRCSALFLSSPVFGAQNTPPHIRVLTTLALSAAVSGAVDHHAFTVPADLGALSIAVGHEVLAGILIGSFMSLALQAAQIAGGFMDVQIGLSMSQVVNPATGMSSTILAQFKFMLGLVVFLSINGHHLLIQALVASYHSMPVISLQGVEHGYVSLLSSVLMIALQISAPVMVVGLLVDAALGLLNRAVPQIQAMLVGIPMKVGLGIFALSIGLPSIVAGTQAAVGAAMHALGPILRM